MLYPDEDQDELPVCDIGQGWDGFLDVVLKGKGFCGIRYGMGWLAEKSNCLGTCYLGEHDSV